MMKEQIGTNAGKIWQKLVASEITDTSMIKVKKECRLNDPDFFMALGWLARENKVKFMEGNKKNVHIFPNE